MNNTPDLKNLEMDYVADKLAGRLNSGAYSIKPTDRVTKEVQFEYKGKTYRSIVWEESLQEYISRKMTEANDAEQ